MRRRPSASVVFLGVLLCILVAGFWIEGANAKLWCEGDDSKTKCFREWVNAGGQLFSFLGAVAAAVFAYKSIAHSRRSADLALIPLLDTRVQRLNEFELGVKQMRNSGMMVRAILDTFMDASASEIAQDRSTFSLLMSHCYRYQDQALQVMAFGTHFDREALQNLAYLVAVTGAAQMEIDGFILFSPVETSKGKTYQQQEMAEVAPHLMAHRDRIYSSIGTAEAAARTLEAEIKSLLGAYGREFLRVEGSHVRNSDV